MRIEPQLLDALALAKAKPELDRLKKAADGVESMFVKDLLAAMRKGTGKSMFGEGYGSQIYQDMFDQALSDSIGKTGMLGISKMLSTQFAKAVLAKTKHDLASGKSSLVDTRQ